MSNATQDSRNSGDNRRRRSRGGKNRNNNQQDNRRGGDRSSREYRGSEPQRAEEFRPQAPRPPRGSRPVQLSWWQKLLKAVGLYTPPAPPARRERKQDDDRPKREPREPRTPKSNTRNAHTNDGDSSDSADSPESTGERRPKRERSERGERSGRGGRGGERPRGGDPSTVEGTRVYVGNLSYDVSEQDLQELFKGVGGVRNVEIVYNRSTHRSKGYGFVEMLHKDDAIRAVEVLHDQHFMGRPLTVSGAQSKGQDDRDEVDDSRAQGPIVVAPIPTPPAEAEAPADAPAEPEIQTIVENVAEASAEKAPAAEAYPSFPESAAAAPADTEPDDLVSKYGFDEPEKKTDDA